MKNVIRLNIQKGFSLIEMMVVLGIVIVLITIGMGFGVIAGHSMGNIGLEYDYQAVYDASKNSSSGANCTGLTDTVLVDHGKVPNMVSNGSILNSKKGAMTVACVSVGSGTDNAVVISSDLIPKSECTTFLKKDAVSYRLEAPLGTVVKGPGVALTIPAITTACSSDNDNEIAVVRLLR